MGVSYVTELTNLLVRKPNNYPHYVVGESYQEIWCFTNKLSKVMVTIFFACLLQIGYMNIAEAQNKELSNPHTAKRAYITEAYRNAGHPDQQKRFLGVNGEETIAELALNIQNK
jgi:hypothetical protein